MSKFKVGDRVVVVLPDHDEFLTIAEVEIVKLDGFSFGIRALDGRTFVFNKNYLMHERDWVELCCKELEKRQISAIWRWYGWENYTYQVEQKAVGNLDDVLDYLYPRQTETQRKLEELEKEARKIADHMKALREGECGQD